MLIRYRQADQEIEPYLVGYDATGHPVVREWQSNEPAVGWREFHITEIASISETGRFYRGDRDATDGVETAIKRVLATLYVT